MELYASQEMTKFSLTIKITVVISLDVNSFMIITSLCQRIFQGPRG